MEQLCCTAAVTVLGPIGINQSMLLSSREAMISQHKLWVHGTNLKMVNLVIILPRTGYLVTILIFRVNTVICKKLWCLTTIISLWIKVYIFNQVTSSKLFICNQIQIDIKWFSVANTVCFVHIFMESPIHTDCWNERIVKYTFSGCVTKKADTDIKHIICILKTWTYICIHGSLTQSWCIIIQDETNIMCTFLVCACECII